MDGPTRQFVQRRAAGRCEYCHLPQAGHLERFSIDHVVARKHGGSDDTPNLAVCCLRCNLSKGTDLSGIDAITGRIVRLFDPRAENWHAHFIWQNSLVVGITPTGRATVDVLKMNTPARRRLREQLAAENLFHFD